MWRSPVAAKWDADLDLEAVLRLGRLYEIVDPSAAVLAQIARLESDLLLNPAARQKAYVTLPVKPQPGGRPANVRPSARERLQAVDPRAALVDASALPKLTAEDLE